MAETYTVSGDVQSNLLKMYERTATLEPMERNKPLFWNEMKKVPNSKPGGEGLFFTVVGAKGHGVGNPTESGDWSTSHTRQQTICQVASAQIDSTVSVTQKYLAAAEGAGSFTGDPDDDLVLEAMDSLLSYGDVLVGAGFGTGALGSVEANVTADNVVQLTLPRSVYQLRENQPIDFVDGSDVVQVQTDILSIDYDASTITTSSNVTVTAGWRVFQRDAIGGEFPNGIENIVDDGTNAATIYTKSRTTFPYLNAAVQDHGGQDYSEEAVDKLINRITYGQDLIPTQLRSNKGIADEHKRLMSVDRTFIQNSNTPPDYNAGTNYENLAYVYGTNKVPWKVDRNLPARTLYALYMPSWGRCVLREPDWASVGGKPFMVAPAAGGDTYSYRLVGSLLMDINIRDKKPKAQGKLTGIKDRHSAGVEDA